MDAIDFLKFFRIWFVFIWSKSSSICDLFCLTILLSSYAHVVCASLSYIKDILKITCWTTHLKDFVFMIETNRKIFPRLHWLVLWHNGFSKPCFQVKYFTLVTQWFLTTLPPRPPFNLWSQSLLSHSFRHDKAWIANRVTRSKVRVTVTMNKNSVSVHLKTHFFFDKAILCMGLQIRLLTKVKVTVSINRNSTSMYLNTHCLSNWSQNFSSYFWW